MNASPTVVNWAFRSAGAAAVTSPTAVFSLASLSAVSALPEMPAFIRILL